eukprot:ANDGO_07917.mRNA.1 hypothetical protein
MAQQKEIFQHLLRESRSSNEELRREKQSVGGLHDTIQALQKQVERVDERIQQKVAETTEKHEAVVMELRWKLEEQERIIQRVPALEKDLMHARDVARRLKAEKEVLKKEYEESLSKKKAEMEMQIKDVGDDSRKRIDELVEARVQESVKQIRLENERLLRSLQMMSKDLTQSIHDNDSLASRVKSSRILSSSLKEEQEIWIQKLVEKERIIEELGQDLKASQQQRKNLEELHDTYVSTSLNARDRDALLAENGLLSQRVLELESKLSESQAIAQQREQTTTKLTELQCVATRFLLVAVNDMEVQLQQAGFSSAPSPQSSSSVSSGGFYYSVLRHVELWSPEERESVLRFLLTKLHKLLLTPFVLESSAESIHKRLPAADGKASARFLPSL